MKEMIINYASSRPTITNTPQTGGSSEIRLDGTLYGENLKYLEASFNGRYSLERRL